MKKRLQKYENDKDLKKEEKEVKKMGHDFWIEEILKGEEFIISSQDF